MWNKRLMLQKHTGKVFPRNWRKKDATGNEDGGKNSKKNYRAKKNQATERVSRVSPRRVHILRWSEKYFFCSHSPDFAGVLDFTSSESHRAIERDLLKKIRR